jgi:hypothetical protein
MKTPVPLLVLSLLLVGCTADVRDQYEIALTKDKRVKQQEADRIDDEQCRREGAQPGTDFYNLCRTRLADKRVAAEEALDRARLLMR